MSKSRIHRHQAFASPHVLQGVRARLVLIVLFGIGCGATSPTLPPTEQAADDQANQVYVERDPQNATVRRAVMNDAFSCQGMGPGFTLRASTLLMGDYDGHAQHAVFAGTWNPVDVDGRTWIVRSEEELCSDTLRQHFRPRPTDQYPLGDSLVYESPLTSTAVECLNRLAPARLSLADWHTGISGDGLHSLELESPQSAHDLTHVRSLHTLCLGGGVRAANIPRNGSVRELHVRDGIRFNAPLEVASRLPSVEKAVLRFTEGALEGLRRLPLQALEVTGVADENLAELAGLESLSRLRLADTSISDAGLSHLSQLQSLSHLDLERTQITGAGLVHLRGLPLRSLNLARTQVDDAALAHLQPLTSITSLNLRWTGVRGEGLSALASMTALSELNLSRTQVESDALAFLSGLPLQNLNLEGTEVNDDGLAHLAQAPLRSLNLASTNVTDAGLHRLTHLPLQRLYLSGGRTAVTGAGMTHLRELPLEVLDVGGLSIDDAGCRAIGEISTLRFLSIRADDFGDAGIRALSGLTSLETLRLTDVYSTSLRPLAALTSLKALTLHSVASSLAPLAQHRSLQMLDLSYGEFADAELSHLASLRLRTLSLRAAESVGDSGLAHVSGMTSLDTLDLRETRVTVGALRHVSQLSLLQTLLIDATPMANSDDNAPFEALEAQLPLLQF